MTNEELISEFRNGNEEAKTLLWEQCQYFVKYYANVFYSAHFKEQNRTDFDSEDLFQSGYIAFLKALEKYDSEKGSFISYLVFFLKTEFYSAAGIRSSKVDPMINHKSLDIPLYDEDEPETMGDLIPCEETGYETVNDLVYQEQLTKELKAALDDLPSREREAVVMRFMEDCTLSDIAKHCNVSSSYAPVLVKNGCKRILEGDHARSLQRFLYEDFDCYSGAGYGTFSRSGSSIEELAVMKYENKMQWRNGEAQKRKERFINYYMDRFNISRREAEEKYMDMV